MMQHTQHTSDLARINVRRQYGYVGKAVTISPSRDTCIFPQNLVALRRAWYVMSFEKCCDWAKGRSRRTSCAKRPVLGLTPFWWYDLTDILVRKCSCHMLPSQPISMKQI